MTAVSGGKVQFCGIDEETEAKKTIRRAERLSLKRREKEAKKKELSKLKEDVRYFLLYLAQTRTDDELIPEVQENAVAMFQVELMFPDGYFGRDGENAVGESEDDKAARLQRAQLEAFCRVVRNLNLPKGSKKQHENQVRILHFMMLCYDESRLYDKELDPFLQFLGGLGRDKTIGDLFAELSGPGREEQARQMGNEMEERLGAGNLPASSLSEEQKTALRVLMEEKKMREAASSGETSDIELEEEEEFVF